MIGARQQLTPSDAAVLVMLAGLWAGSAWERLEVTATDEIGYGGYCVPVGGALVWTADALSSPATCPPVITRLAALLRASGWQRLEIVGRPGGGCAGWCERPDGSGISFYHADETPAARVDLAGLPRLRDLRDLAGGA